MDAQAAGRSSGALEPGGEHQRVNGGQSAQKNELNPWPTEQWHPPPEQSAAFVRAMEDVLEVYARPRDEKRPLVCLDEFCKQLIADTREPVAAHPGRLGRADYEYERRGMCSAFMAYSPLEQWRGVRVSGRRTAQDWAQSIKWLCDEVYPQAEKIVLLQDNLNAPPCLVV